MAKANLRIFDYKKVAKLDTDMWRSYAGGNKSPFKLFVRAFKLIKYQLGFSWSATVKLAYNAAWAAFGYRLKKKGKENYARSEKYLIRLFKTISENNNRPFDFEKAASLELEWWGIQRYPDKYAVDLASSLNANMTAVYGTRPNTIKGYGRYRAEALSLLEKSDTEIDFEKMEVLLLEAWKSLHESVQSQ